LWVLLNPTVQRSVWLLVVVKHTRMLVAYSPLAQAERQAAHTQGAIAAALLDQLMNRAVVVVRLVTAVTAVTAH